MKTRESRWLRLRICAVAFLYFGLFSVVILRGYQLQISQGEELSKRADRQLIRKIALAPARGRILDRNGEELASNREVGSVFVQPGRIVDAAVTADRLSEFLSEERDEILKKLGEKSPFVWLKRGMSLERADELAALNLKGVGVLRERRRYYPNMELAGHIVGFAGVDSQGLEGVELAYDKFIKGNAGYVFAERDALGRNIFPKGVASESSSSGHDVFLTIDKTMQYVTERELGAAVAKFKAKGGTAIVMDPHRGEILAMAVQPSFNPNFFEQSTAEIWKNKALMDTYDPGSTFKIFLAAAAIDSGKVRGQDIFFCENGRYKVYDTYIHDTKEYGWLSMENIVKVSSNIGAYKIAEKLGKKSFYRYIKDFGFGEKTGVGLPERSGYVRPAKGLSPVGFANLSFGQGISVTALQLVNAISVVANGGYLMKPYLVKKVVDKEGQTVFSNFPTQQRRVISERAARRVADMLQRVISEKGTGGRAALEGYHVAGKTGTSQKYDPKTGKYSRERYIGSFIGFLPADNPKLSILVLLDEPQDSHYGGTVAAPVFRKIAEQALAYMKVTPGHEKALPKNYMRAMASPENSSLGENIKAVFSSDTKGRMPNLKGMTLREILLRMGIPPARVRGTGVVVEQRPLPGGAFEDRSGYSVILKSEPKGVRWL